MKIREIASGFAVSEGPIAFPDGSFLVVECLSGRVSRVTKEGKRVTLSESGGGPNGAAMGPDGRAYICNNGGFTVQNFVSILAPGPQPDRPPAGRIEAIDVKTGAFEVIYKTCGDRPLVGPNDIVFDRAGGFYFTDLGRFWGTYRPPGYLYYAKPDGSSIREAAGPLGMVNGIGLSSDENTLYTVESDTGFLLAFDIASPGTLKTRPGRSCGARLVYHDGVHHFDSLAVDAEGHVCAACPGQHKIARISPGGEAQFFDMPPGSMPTNICFGGPDLRTAYVTLGQAGTLVSFEWPVPGHPLNFLNR